MGTTRKLYIVRFTSTGISRISGQKYSRVHNTCGIILDKGENIDEKIERYRKMGHESMQEANPGIEVETKASITATHTVIAVLK
jgi:hypothetical protein